jgi:hypothetical protein
VTKLFFSMGAQQLRSIFCCSNFNTGADINQTNFVYVYSSIISKLFSLSRGPVNAIFCHFKLHGWMIVLLVVKWSPWAEWYKRCNLVPLCYNTVVPCCIVLYSFVHHRTTTDPYMRWGLYSLNLLLKISQYIQKHS